MFVSQYSKQLKSICFELARFGTENVNQSRYVKINQNDFTYPLDITLHIFGNFMRFLITSIKTETSAPRIVVRSQEFGKLTGH